MNDWIKCSEELPPCDGSYAICCDPSGKNYTDYFHATYDGYGFLVDDIYRNPKYWKTVPPLVKKYGKQTKED